MSTITMSRERIAELREWAERIVAESEKVRQWYAQDAGSEVGAAAAAEYGSVFVDIIAVLDAYEAQRPRPASGPPDRPCLVQVAVHPECYRAPVRALARYYQHGWEQSDDPGPGAQYDDARGVYMCPAGWYEARAEYGDDCSPDCRIPDADVRCWWPLQPLPKGGDE